MMVLSLDGGWKVIDFGFSHTWVERTISVICPYRVCFLQLTDAYLPGDSFAVFVNDQMCGVGKAKVAYESDPVTKPFEAMDGTSDFAKFHMTLPKGRFFVRIFVLKSPFGGGIMYGRLAGSKDNYPLSPIMCSLGVADINNGEAITRTQTTTVTTTVTSTWTNVNGNSRTSEGLTLTSPCTTPTCSNTSNSTDENAGNNAGGNGRGEAAEGSGGCPGKGCEEEETKFDFTILTPVPFKSAQAACKKGGMHLADINLFNYMSATTAIYEKLGQNGFAWIRGWNGDEYSGACIALQSGIAGSGSINRLECEKEAHVLCVK